MPLNTDLALRLLDLSTATQVNLVSPLAYAARRALAGRPFPVCDLTECLSGRCESCEVRRALSILED